MIVTGALSFVKNEILDCIVWYYFYFLVCVCVCDQTKSGCGELRGGNMSLVTLDTQLREALHTLDAVQRASTETTNLVQKHHDLERELESLREWKTSASTTIQFLQQQLMQRQAPFCPPCQVEAPRDVAMLDCVSVESQDGGSVRPQTVGDDDEGTTVCSPTTDIPPTIATDATVGSPTMSEPSVRFVDTAQSVACQQQGEVLVAQREALDEAKARIKTLEEELTVTRARWAAAETRCQHSNVSSRSLHNSASTAVMQLHYRDSVESIKGIMVESACELRDALMQSGALALPLLPHSALDATLLVITLRDHCRMAAKRIRILESLE
jgi:hypothetical protein